MWNNGYILRINRFFAVILCATIICFSLESKTDAAEHISGVYTTEATLYIPDFMSAELQEKHYEEIEVSTRVPLEKALLNLLIEEIADTVPDEFSLLHELSLLAPGYVRSRDVALIHLTGEVLSLDPLSRFTLCQAITNTICAPGQIKACLILSDGKALSLDEAQTIPAGVFAPNEYADPLTAMSQLLLRHTESETENLHYRGNTALFYPTSAGHGVVCEVKALTYASEAPEVAVRTIIGALSEADLFDVPELPPLNDYMTEDPRIETVDGTDQILVLRFDAELSRVLSEFGILRSVLMASITMSLQSYFPWLQGVRCEIGGEAILAIVPVGLFDGANEAISFERGYMHWQDFSHFVLTDIALYFTDDNNKLTETLRYIPSNWASDPQQLLEQLFAGPSYYDSVSDLKALFDGPERLSETLISISSNKNQLILDFNLFFWGNQSDLSSEQNAVYSMVNTLTRLQWCRRVTLTVNGKTPEGLLSYETPFMRSMDYRR